MKYFENIIEKLRIDKKYLKAVNKINYKNTVTFSSSNNLFLKSILLKALSNNFPLVVFVVLEKNYIKYQNLLNTDKDVRFQNKKNENLMLKQLLNGNIKTLVITIDDFVKKYPSIKHFQDNNFELKKNYKINFQNVILNLLQIGYKRQQKTILPGDFSIKGSILDIFPYGCKYPVRIEFFNNDIEQIFLYDLYTGQKLKNIKNINLTPVFLKTKKARIFEWLNLNNLIVFDEVDDIKEHLRDLNLLTDSIKWKKIISQKNKKAYFSQIPLNNHNSVWLDFKQTEKFCGNFQRFFNRVKNLLESNYRIIINSKNTKIKYKFRNNSKIKFVNYQISKGFYYPNEKIVVFSDYDIFGDQRKVQIIRKKKEEKEFLKNIKIGDHIVHIDHGIGEFIKIDHLPAAIISSDFKSKEKYLYIKFFGDDMIYVPTSMISKITRYIGITGKKPLLSKLGSAVWKKTISQSKEHAQKIAKDLLSIYSLRSKIAGFKFKPNLEWEKQLEDSFEYEETQDQKKVICEIFKDMEKSKPMDRLLAGDVGFGKTEVAIRASLRAITSGKQVAILAPTTILAEQHKGIFRKRLNQFPINIESLSRFKTKKDQAKTIKKIKSGKIDLIIGTHRLLQKDINFKDLGLIIIDEEQRFGVKHKEKLKRLRAQIDVLIMTATPIPRTLQMALSGIRQISYLTTPPEGRFSINIKIAHTNDELIKRSIIKEIKRKGQVYYLTNSVSKILAKTKKIKKLLPKNIEIAIAHGQMKEELLADTMKKFAEGKIDVLVCTTIIENGLDLDNVNTIIIEDAQKFGLSQLYQLKGRVGRGAKKAYSLLLVPFRANLGKDARKRLSALLEARELGSGLQIAEQDLEIRGGGNILGKEQSGRLAQIGLVLYSQLLKQAIKRLKINLSTSSQ